jgi:hypothetical protein
MLGDRHLDDRCKVEQTKGVGDGRAGSPDARGDLLVREAEIVDQLAKALGSFDRIEVLALQVLDERELELRSLVEVANERGDSLETGVERSPNAALTGDQLIAIDRLSDEDGLEHAVLADARRERGHLGRVEMSPRLLWVRSDAHDRDLDCATLAGRARRDER